MRSGYSVVGTLSLLSWCNSFRVFPSFSFKGVVGLGSCGGFGREMLA
jgi:hypothetical protein